MTEELFREDATLVQCEAQVLAVDEVADASAASGAPAAPPVQIGRAHV